MTSDKSAPPRRTTAPTFLGASEGPALDPEKTTCARETKIGDKCQGHNRNHMPSRRSRHHCEEDRPSAGMYKKDGADEDQEKRREVSKLRSVPKVKLESMERKKESLR